MITSVAWILNTTLMIVQHSVLPVPDTYTAPAYVRCLCTLLQIRLWAPLGCF